jgi:phosphoribosylaminoimidazole-succinocarboxamide synthase
VRTHLVSRLSPRDQLVRKVQIIPIEFVVRNVAAGSLVKRFGREAGEVLSRPMVELFYKSDALHDPPMSDEHALIFGWAARWELEYCRAAALEVNRALRDFWDGLGVTLVDFKLEFGRHSSGAILLADEITPDGSRLWEKGTNRRLDKDVFRWDLGDLTDTYRELYRRIFGAALPTGTEEAG